MTGSPDYNESYYEIIDKIENEIFNKGSLEELLSEYEGIKSGKVDVESIAQKFYGQNTGYENIGWKEIDAEQFSVQSYTVGSFEVDD